MTVPGGVIVGDSFEIDWLYIEPPSFVVDPPVVISPVASFTFVQVVAQSVWIVPHNLGHYPVAWSLYETSSGRLCDEYTVEHLDVNTCRVSMDTPTAGLFRLI